MDGYKEIFPGSQCKLRIKGKLQTICINFTAVKPIKGTSATSGCRAGRPGTSNRRPTFTN